MEHFKQHIIEEELDAIERSGKKERAKGKKIKGLENTTESIRNPEIDMRTYEELDEQETQHYRESHGAGTMLKNGEMKHGFTEITNIPDPDSDWEHYGEAIDTIDPFEESADEVLIPSHTPESVRENIIKLMYKTKETRLPDIDENFIADAAHEAQTEAERIQEYFDEKPTLEPKEHKPTRTPNQLFERFKRILQKKNPDFYDVIKDDVKGKSETDPLLSLRKQTYNIHTKEMGHQKTPDFSKTRKFLDRNNDTI